MDIKMGFIFQTEYHESSEIFQNPSLTEMTYLSSYFVRDYFDL